MEPRRESRVLTTFRTSNDHERAVILGRQIEDVQLSVRSANNALAQVARQVDDLLEYQRVLEADIVSDPHERLVLVEALNAWAWQARTHSSADAEIAARLADRFSESGGSDHA
jgi:hypothetical protein